MFGRAPNGFQDYRDTEMNLEKDSDRENRLLFLNQLLMRVFICLDVTFL